MNTTTKTYFQFNGQTFQIKDINKSNGWDQESRKIPRAYVWGAPEISITPVEDEAKRLGLDNIHTRRGEFPSLDQAWNKYNRQVVAAQRLVLETALDHIVKEPGRMSFSRKAGCSCGCSPGFILKDMPRGHSYYISKVEDPQQ